MRKISILISSTQKEVITFQPKYIKDTKGDIDFKVNTTNLSAYYLLPEDLIEADIFLGMIIGML
jgi:hypothetical protein